MKVNDAFKGDVFSSHHERNLMTLSDETGVFGVVNIACEKEIVTSISMHDELVEALDYLVSGNDSYDVSCIVGMPHEWCQKNIIDVLAKAKGE